MHRPLLLLFLLATIGCELPKPAQPSAPSAEEKMRLSRECAAAAEHYWKSLRLEVDTKNDYTSHFNAQRSECLILRTETSVTRDRIIVDETIEDAVDRVWIASRHEDADSSKGTNSVLITGTPFPSDQRAAQEQWLKELIEK